MIPAPDGRGGPQVIPRPANAELGGPPPWNHLRESERRIDLHQVVRSIESYRPALNDRGVFEATSRTSAVLVPLYEAAGEPMVILTRRSPTMRAHTHEVSFPGGRRDPDDADHLRTALREAHEEIALEPDAVRVVGALDHFVTGGSGSLVHPYVGVLDRPPKDLAANPAEVEQILHVNLNELLLDAVWREEIWQRDGKRLAVTFFELHGDTVWGATGNMLRQLLTLATDPR